MKSLMKQEYKEEILKIAQNKKLERVLTFDLEKDLNLLHELAKQSLHGNVFISFFSSEVFMKIPKSFVEVIIDYFTSRIMHYLNEYAKQEGKFYESDKTVLYRGLKLSYSNILLYERAKGKIIILSSLTSTSQEIKVAECFSGRKDSQSLYDCRQLF